MNANDRRLLAEWNQTDQDYPRDKCLHELFEAQVKRTPKAVAIHFNEEQLTYAEVNQRANQVAHYLRGLGVGPETLVGLCVERSPRMVIGLLGILKAGGAYVPLDPAYPKERLRFVLEDAGVTVLLTEEKLLGELGDGIAACKIVRLDSDGPAISTASVENPDGGAGPESLAYVIYTSGSTGKPKGVAIEHHSPVMLVSWAHGVFSAEECAGVLFATSICFDLSVFEMFVPLCRGGKLILVENALELATAPAASQVTLVNTVPSAIRELIRLQAVPSSVGDGEFGG